MVKIKGHQQAAGDFPCRGPDAFSRNDWLIKSAKTRPNIAVPKHTGTHKCKGTSEHAQGAYICKHHMSIHPPIQRSLPSLTSPHAHRPDDNKIAPLSKLLQKHRRKHADYL